MNIANYKGAYSDVVKKSLNLKLSGPTDTQYTLLNNQKPPPPVETKEISMPPAEKRPKRLLLLCMDAEMTGLHGKQHRILEIALILSDPHLNKLGMYQAVCSLSALELANAKLEEWSEITHTETGLLEDVKNSKKNAAIIDTEICDFIYQACNQDLTNVEIQPIGFSISNDLKLIEKEFPKFYSLLDYRIIELKSFQTMFSLFLTRNQKHPPPKIFEPRHRARPDADSAWNYFLYVKKLLKRIPDTNTISVPKEIPPKRNMNETSYFSAPLQYYGSTPPYYSPYPVPVVDYNYNYNYNPAYCPAYSNYYMADPTNSFQM